MTAKDEHSDVPRWRGLGGGSKMTNVTGNMYNNNHYNKRNQRFAYEPRQNLTKSEACLWKYALRAGGMKGYSFRRQRPILNFIVDFVCMPLKLVIEVDGYSHFLDDVLMKDSIKDETLKEAGYEIVRFTDKQVLTDIANVISEIERTIECLEKGDLL
jgi:very-short-patch-repair endonuclease